MKKFALSLFILLNSFGLTLYGKLEEGSKKDLSAFKKEILGQSSTALTECYCTDCAECDDSASCSSD